MSSESEFNALFTHHRAPVNDAVVHYVVGGQGDPVVLLHGITQTWLEWKRIMPALAERYTVIALDLRGLGDSSKPMTGYDSRTVAQDVHALVHDTLGFKRIFLVGHDYGGTTGYAYAVAHPEEVRRLAFLEMALPGFGYEQALNAVPGGGNWFVGFFTIPDWAEALMQGKVREFFSWVYRRNAYDPTAISNEDLEEYAERYSTPGGMRVLSEYYRAIWQNIEHNRESAKTPLKMPVLALGGDACLGDLPLRCMQAVAEDVRGGVIENCGHWIPDERPDYLLDQLLTFFEEESTVEKSDREMTAPGRA